MPCDPVPMSVPAVREGAVGPHASVTAAGPVSQAGEDRSLTQGTAGWASLGAQVTA